MDREREICRLMHHFRQLSNTPDFDRESALTELESLRKELGGFQFAPLPKDFFFSSSDIAREEEMKSRKRPPVFVKCPVCYRNLHNSVVGPFGCYSCQQAAGRTEECNV